MHKDLITLFRTTSNYHKSHVKVNKNQLQKLEGFFSEKLKLTLY